jgi:hypothetical protein
MNTNTGEIAQFPAGTSLDEIKKKGFDRPLSSEEIHIIDSLSPEQRVEWAKNNPIPNISPSKSKKNRFKKRDRKSR